MRLSELKIDFNSFLQKRHQAKNVYCNAQLHFIDGGSHGFSKKHDKIAMEYLTQFIS